VISDPVYVLTSRVFFFATRGVEILLGKLTEGRDLKGTKQKQTFRQGMHIFM